jgi:hypothetical protein
MPEPHVKITDSNSDRVQALLDRIEQNYGRLDERLDELEELVPVTLERVQRSMQTGASPQDSSHQKSASPGKPR